MGLTEVRIHALRMLATDLRDTLDAAAAAGLAAPHIGVAQRVVVLRPEPGTPASLYVNPEIAWASPERVAGPEGSVSMPGITDELERTRQALDENRAAIEALHASVLARFETED